MSESEPELGLGFLSKVENKLIKITFQAAETERTYGIKGAPIKRVFFSTGDEVSLRSGKKRIIHSVIFQDGLAYYKSDSEIFDERELADSINFNKPEDKLYNGIIDSPALFELRLKTHLYKNQIVKSLVRGFIGGRLDLIPHQFFVAKEISSRMIPRVLLADEVGLGKTIEAGLLLHHLILSERVERALILVPDSLVYQWFVEMLRKFNLIFVTLNQETYLEPDTNPFTENNFVIVNIGLLKGAELARKLMSEAHWDLMIVDEAHQLKWSTEFISNEYKIAAEIAKNAKGLLLLTATPEQLGMEGHFARLMLLDPNRFFDYSKFCTEVTHYENFAKKARQLIEEGYEQNEKRIKELQDLHGPGRIFFRNTRDRMGKHFSFFPKRILHSYILENSKKFFLALEDEELIGASFDLKIDWLMAFIEKNFHEKILLITKSKTKVLCLEKLLKERLPHLKVGTFHSGLSFLARDRQAAYFSDPEGANLLLCTEIGSEGRNFEFSKHLILFDLPIFPDLLEQRIGRLDRIGQKNDINIHVPFIKNSYEEILFLWFESGLNAFCHPAKGVNIIYEEQKMLLLEYLKHPEKCLKNQEVLEEFLNETKKKFLEITKKSEEGRDLLIELNSFKKDEANKIIETIKTIDEDPHLSQYMSTLFQELGVDVEDLSENIFFIKPNDNMYIPYFPCLPITGVRITYDRNTAIQREDVEFLSWDHPMVLGIMDLILSNNWGNVSVMMRKKSGPKKMFLEAFFKLQVIAPKKLNAEKFFPPEGIRILIDSTGENFSEKFSKNEIDEKIIPAESAMIKKIKTSPKTALQEILQHAQRHAQIEGDNIRDTYKKIMLTSLEGESLRLLKLKAINPEVRQEEIDEIHYQKKALTKSFEDAEIVLDSFRLIF